MSRFPHLAAGVVASFAVAIAIAATFEGRALAQNVLLDIKSSVPGDDAVHAIAIGDWDGDGIPDLAIGAPHDNTAGSLAGAVHIHSGKDGSILTTLYGTNAGDQFGAALARMPDLNGDGVDDLAVASIYADHGGTDVGTVYLYAGRSGALLLQIDGPPTRQHFGSPLGSLGDVDGDGIADLFVGNSGENDVVHVRSGADGHEIRTLRGVKDEQFGYSACAIHDLDRDGVRELLVGARAGRDSSGNLVGAAYVVSPVNGRVLRTHLGTFSNESLGRCTTALQDMDGDSVADYAVSTFFDDNFQGSMVLVFSGTSGVQLAKIEEASQVVSLGQQVIDAGDVNGDGVGDLAINGGWFDANQHGFGAIFLFSGKTFLQLDRVDFLDRGDVLAPFGDLNGDGLADFLVGSVDSSFNGEVFLFSGDPLWLKGTPGQPVAGDTLDLTTREGVPGALTVQVLVGVDGIPTFQIVDAITTFDATGGDTYSATVPPGLAGHEFTFKAFANDAAGHVIASATDTLAFK